MGVFGRKPVLTKQASCPPPPPPPPSVCHPPTPLFFSRRLVALAIFFHDAVYAPAAAPRQNELDSASLFRSFWASALPQPPAGFGDAGEVVSAWIERTAVLILFSKFNFNLWALELILFVN